MTCAAKYQVNTSPLNYQEATHIFFFFTCHPMYGVSTLYIQKITGLQFIPSQMTYCILYLRYRLITTANKDAPRH